MGKPSDKAGKAPLSAKEKLLQEEQKLAAARQKAKDQANKVRQAEAKLFEKLGRKAHGLFADLPVGDHQAQLEASSKLIQEIKTLS